MANPGKPRRKRKQNLPTWRQKIGGLAFASALTGLGGWQVFSAVTKGEMYGRGSLVMQWSVEPVLFAAVFAFFLLLLAMGLILLAGLAVSATAPGRAGVRLLRLGRPGRDQVEVEIPAESGESARRK